MDEHDDEKQAVRDAVANELRARRAYRRISQSQLIKMSGISKSTIERLELGKRDLDIPQLVLLSRALEFDPGEFMRSVQDALED
ncbi:helix-turn-helix domain-containing protein [Rhodococcus hoagii]|nr:helix-turn-helix domain-containing protein [Prescottella equi]